MAYEIRGWLNFTIELAHDHGAEDDLAFKRALKEEPGLLMFWDLENAAAGGPPINAMVEGQELHTLWLRYSGPAYALAFTLPTVIELARRHFPPPPVE